MSAWYYICVPLVAMVLQVIMGGGRREFLPTHETDIDGIRGRRTDGEDLIKHWQHHHSHHRSAYVQNRVQLLEVIRDTKTEEGGPQQKHRVFTPCTQIHKLVDG